MTSTGAKLNGRNEHFNIFNIEYSKTIRGMMKNKSRERERKREKERRGGGEEKKQKERKKMEIERN